jgi:two-component system, OmpR family, phosphate regulon sensor histidine kinase PhoR
MRRPSSIGDRLKVGFALFVVLIAAVGALVYAGFARQEGANRQLNERIYVLRHATSELDAAFSDGQLAIANYQLTFETRFLTDYDADTAYFDSQLAIMRRYAPRGMRDLVDRQDRAGAAWSELSNQIIANPASTAADTAQTDKEWATNESFTAANIIMMGRINATISDLVRDSNRTLGIGLAWTTAALVVALGLGLIIATGTVRRTLGPLRRLTGTVNRLTAGDYAARAHASGPTEIRDVAFAVNMLADESDRLREQETVTNRLRAMARETGLRIREHLHADDVIREARKVLEENLDADVVYLHLIRDGKMGPPEGHEHDWLLPGEFLDSLPSSSFRLLEDLLRNQASLVIQDVRGPGGDQFRPEIRDALRQAGVVSHLLIPFGVGSELLGMIVADRLHAGHPWAEAEIDAVQSIAADLGRGLHHARLYEEENRLVAELKSIDRAKSDFVATVSHELRTPLTSIRGYVEMLLDHDLGKLSPEQERTLETVGRNATRLQDLIEDLLTLSAIEAGTFTTVTKPANLLDIIGQAEEEVQPAVLSKRITLTTTCPPDGLVVNGDAGQLMRVLINLLSNAVKFTPAGGRVQVTAVAAGGWAVLSVADTGIGIPDADRKDLFTRFFRASNATQRAIPGTGLGLAIVQSIVAAHGGDLNLESQEGHGTTVTVRLPLAEPAEPAQPSYHEAERRRAAAASGTPS